VLDAGISLVVREDEIEEIEEGSRLEPEGKLGRDEPPTGPRKEKEMAKPSPGRP
jgi:hypothetical protein